MTSISNDIHHMFYRGQLEDTKLSDVVVLCRECHEEIHKEFDPGSFDDLNSGRLAFKVSAIKRLRQLQCLDNAQRRIANSRRKRGFKTICWCCRTDDVTSCAYYNIFKFSPKFQMQEYHFFFLCENCGNFMWENIDVDSCHKTRQVFAQYLSLRKTIGKSTRIKRLKLSVFDRFNDRKIDC